MTERTNVVVLAEMVSRTYNATGSNRINLLNKLTNNNADPELKNAVLDITDVPVDYTTFNIFILDLIKNTHLIVVDNSYEFKYSGEEVEYFDTSEMNMKKEKLAVMQYPERISAYYEQLGVTKEEFVNSFERSFNPEWCFRYRDPSNGDFQLEKVYDEGIVYKKKVKGDRITVRQDIIDRVTYRRDGELSSVSLIDFIPKEQLAVEEGVVSYSSNQTYSEDALRGTLDYINNHFTSGNTTLPIFNVKNIASNKESKMNLAKLVILANELMEFSDLSSGKSLVIEGVTSYAMQYLYDFSDYNSFVDDICNKVHEGDVLAFYEGTEVDRLTVLEKTVVEHKGVSNKVIFKCTSKLGMDELMRNPDADLDEDVKLEVEIDLYRVYSCNAIVLPIGILTGGTEGMPTSEERSKYFDKTEFKEFVRTINVDGINPLISSTFDFSSSSNYTNIYRKAMEVLYEKEGWGKVPELDLLKIVKGEDSPFTINL